MLLGEASTATYLRTSPTNLLIGLFKIEKPPQSILFEQVKPDPKLGPPTAILPSKNRTLK